MRRALGALVVLVLASAPVAAAKAKPAPFWYWTPKAAVKNVVHANPQIGVQLTHHTTISGGTCKGFSRSLLRQRQRVFHAFDCMLNVHDSTDNTDSAFTFAFVTSKTRRNAIGCWGRAQGDLVAKHCL